MSIEPSNIPPSVRHDYAQVGEVRLHYAVHGSGDKLVLLLHGFPECWYSWRNQLAALGDEYQVVAPDLRGYNLSDKPLRVEDYRINKLVDDVTGLIHHFDSERAIIVGHDWGAIIAWVLAARYPSYVERLVSLQVPPPAVWRKNFTLQQALRSWYMLFFQLPRIPEWLIRRNDFQALERVFRETPWRRGTFSEHDIDVYKAAFERDGALTSAINYYRANVPSLFLPGKNSSDTESRINVPTLFIYGERDVAIVPQSVRNVDTFIDAPYREVRIATSGHWVQQEAPHEVNQALNNFFAEAIP